MLLDCLRKEREQDFKSKDLPDEGHDQRVERSRFLAVGQARGRRMWHMSSTI